MRFSGEAVLRLVIAVVLGAIIGAEREASEQPAGLRTHIAVCLGAATFGIVSTIGFTEFEAERGTTNVQVDVTRVASQVVVGIGFLGAGIIFRERASIRNLTTAASLWVTSAIGLLAGVGDLGTAATATVVLTAVLVALLPLRSFIRSRFQRPTRDLSVLLVAGASPAALVAAVRALPGIDVDRVHVGKLQGRPSLTMRLRARPGADIDGHVATLAARDDVTDIESPTVVHD